MRAKEMEKMKEEMRMYKEKQRQDMIRREQEERLKAGWMVTEFAEEVHTQLEADVVVCDLNKSLLGEEMDKFKKAVEVLKEKVAAAEKELKEQEEKEKEAREAKLRILKEEAERKRLAEKPKIEEKEADFDENLVKLSKPELTDKEEKELLTQLIKDKRSALVRQLIIEMNVKGIQGKSPIFKALSKKFTDDINKRKGLDLKPPDGEKKLDSKSGEEPKESEEERKRKLDSNVEGGSREPKKAKEGDGDVKEAPQKRKASGESGENRETKKVKSELNGDSDKSKLLIGALVSKSADAGDKKKESQHKDEKKHKKDRERDRDRDREKDKDREREKAKKKDKDRDRERDKDREREKESDREKHKKSKKEKHHKHDKDRGEEVKAKKVGSEVRSSIDETSNISSASTEKDQLVSMLGDVNLERVVEKASKPLLEMSPHEIRQHFKLKQVDCFVKAKNRRKVDADFQSFFPTTPEIYFSGAFLTKLEEMIFDLFRHMPFLESSRWFSLKLSFPRFGKVTRKEKIREKQKLPEADLTLWNPAVRNLALLR